MKTLKTLLLSVGAVALLGAGGLYAQTKATATIPFEFTVQNTTLPAGDYTLSATSASHDVMTIRNAETRKAVMVLAPSAERTASSGSLRTVRASTRLATFELAITNSRPAAAKRIHRIVLARALIWSCIRVTSIW